MRAQLCNPQLGVWDRLTKLLNEDNPEKRQIVIQSHWVTEQAPVTKEPQTALPTCTKRREQWNSPEKEQGISETKFNKKELSENPLTDAWLMPSRRMN